MPRRPLSDRAIYAERMFGPADSSELLLVHRAILEEVGGGSLRDHFEKNIHDAGLGPWVRIHQGRAGEVARSWTTPIDLLYLDGDQSRKGVREAYDGWAQFLRAGGIIAVHNSAPENPTPEHDGHRCIVEEEIKRPHYCKIRLVCSTTFAIKARSQEL